MVPLAPFKMTLAHSKGCKNKVCTISDSKCTRLSFSDADKLVACRKNVRQMVCRGWKLIYTRVYPYKDKMNPYKDKINPSYPEEEQY